ncbi:Ribonuclease H1 [Leucoagaricus sp. SymC.cos]|nr:Ribonuclease H1 [Leucoagaricus sp. SymC.cos]
MSHRIYHPPRIGNQTPQEIFQESYGSNFTFIRKRYPSGVTTTSNIAIFADGACTDNGKPSARAGMGVYFGPGSRYNFHQALNRGRPTNQRAEIRAAMLALHKVRELIENGELRGDTKTVVLVLDSAYVVNAMTDWVTKWKGNGWRDVNGRVVANKGDFQELDTLIDELESDDRVYVKLWHVDRTHNTGADQEARKAIGWSYGGSSQHVLTMYCNSDSDSDY